MSPSTPPGGSHRPRQPYAADERLAARCALLERELRAVLAMLGHEDECISLERVAEFIRQESRVVAAQYVMAKCREAFDAGAEAMREEAIRVQETRLIKRLKTTGLQGRP